MFKDWGQSKHYCTPKDRRFSIFYTMRIAKNRHYDFKALENIKKPQRFEFRRDKVSHGDT